jgi:hypothetical protein
VQRSNILLSRAERGVPCGEALEHGASLDHLDRLNARHGPNVRAAVWLTVDKTILFEPRERHSHRGPSSRIGLR